MEKVNQLPAAAATPSTVVEKQTSIGQDNGWLSARK